MEKALGGSVNTFRIYALFLVTLNWPRVLVRISIIR